MDLCVVQVSWRLWDSRVGKFVGLLMIYVMVRLG